MMYKSESQAVQPTIVFYHRSDLDGICSGAICKQVYPDAIFIGIEYGDDFPWHSVVGTKVVMVDFCLQPFDDMIRLKKEAGQFIWIDHHKSAIEEATKHNFQCEGLRGIGNAACELTWCYFNSETALLYPERIPRVIRLLGRYDIWKWQDEPGAIEFQYWARRQKLKVASPQWNELFSLTDLTQQIQVGSEIYNEMKESNAELIAKLGFEFEWNGYRVIACNRGPTSSQLFDSRFDPSKHDLMMPFYFNGSKWIISLYTTKDNIDCSEIAKANGGGGHKGAAGFTRKTLPAFLAGTT